MGERMLILVRIVAAVAVAGLALGSGVVAAFAGALLGHEILVAIYGGNLAPIDDTPPMQVEVATSYLAGVVVGLIVLTVGWRRIARWRR